MTPPRDPNRPRRARRSCARALAAVLLAGPSAAFALGAPQQEEELDEGAPTRGFAIPRTHEAAALAQRAADHLAARRDIEALQTLQELIVSHRGQVLLEPGQQLDQRAPVYVGAVEWARRKLAELPPATIAAYRTRHEAQARADLETALAAADSRGLAELARRYPRTLAAVRAWRALGDLELERDNLEVALAAWRRAAELEGALEPTPAAGATLRAEQAEIWRRARPELSAAAAPGPDAATWTATLAPENAGGPFARGDTYSLYACTANDLVFVSDTLRVWAFDGWSGERRWVSAEFPEWRSVDRGQVHPAGERPLRRDDFFEQVDRGQIMVRPATAGGVVVAAIQAPFSLVGNRNYQQFSITKVTPERRLVGYDAQTGAVLWNHLPPPLWDGESGPYEQLMSVGAAPTIAGSRVIVASHRMRGRVDFHVACYDLNDGRLLWSTPLVSGQVELNMFGRAQREYTAAPVAVDGERVFVATQLGAVAALDLFSGDILWEALYEQTPIPRAEHWRTEMRRQYFASAAPVIAPGAVVVAPTDGRDVLAFDPASGARLWRRPHDFFARVPNVVTLLEAKADALWLSTDRVLVSRATRGLASTVGLTSVESSLELYDTQPRPRAQLNATQVVVPSGSRRVALDRERLTEDRRSSAEWADGQLSGNVLLSDGVAYFVTDSRVSAAVDWRVVSERFARQCAEAPADPRPHLGWAAILARRGMSELGGGANEAAARLLQEAAQKLERWLDTEDPALRAQARERFVRTALSCADALARSASLRPAVEWVERAAGLAVGADALASALVRKAELEQALKRSPERAQTLASLAERCGAAYMPTDWFEREDSLRYQGLDPRQRVEALTVGAYVAIEQALDAQRELNVAREYEVLHTILARYGDLRLPALAATARESESVSASARIGALLAAGERAAYEPYERAAVEWLERARAEEDFDALERLALLYPHSRAAGLAERSRREAALAGADLNAVVQLCVRATPDDWDMAKATDDELHAQWVLRAALTEAGNHEFAAALFERLERDHGARVSPLARDKGRTLADLRAESARQLPELGAPSATLAPSSIPMAPVGGSVLLLGLAPLTPPEGPVQWAQVLCRRDRNLDTLSAWGGEGGERPLWSTQTPQGAAFPGWRAQCSAGALILGNRGGLLALEGDSGDARWEWSSSGARVDSFQARSGVVLVATTSPDGSALVALDARLGLELWARPIRPESWGRPIVGEHAVALLPSDFAQSPVDVLDIFTGARLTTISLASHVGLADAEGAWIEHGRLIVPSFPKSSAAGEHDCLTAWELASGRRSWRVLSEAHQEFDSVLRAEGRTYLILLPRADADSGGQGAVLQGAVLQGAVVQGAVLDLDTKLGAVRRVPNAALGLQDVLVGVSRHRVVTTSHPYLFVRSDGADGASTLVRALHLPFGERWSVQLDIAPSQLNTGGPMPAPVVTSNAVAITYTYTPRTKGQRTAPNANLVLVNRESGAVLERSALPPELGPADKLEFAALGGVLWIAGLNQMLVRR
jgi:outer membrane protein assembly factor BamB